MINSIDILAITETWLHFDKQINSESPNLALVHKWTKISQMISTYPREYNVNLKQYHNGTYNEPTT